MAFKQIFASVMCVMLVLTGCAEKKKTHSPVSNPVDHEKIQEVQGEDIQESTSQKEPLVFTKRILEETNYDFNHDGVPEYLELEKHMVTEYPEQLSYCNLRVMEQDGTPLWTIEAGTAHVGWISVFACEIGQKDYLMVYSPYRNTGCADYIYRIFSIGKEGNEEVLRENQVGFDLMFGSNVHQKFPTEDVVSFLEEVHQYLDTADLLLTTEQGSLVVGGCGKDFTYDRFWDTTADDDSSSMAEQIRTYVASRESNVENSASKSIHNQESEISFEKTIFTYDGFSYDVTSRVKSINSILSVVPVGEKLVIECHVGPKNGVYCIFNTIKMSFETDLNGNHLTWYNDNLTTAVYSFGADVYSYDGRLIKSYALSENDYIYGLDFSDDCKKLNVTILSEEGTEQMDVITL